MSTTSVKKTLAVALRIFALLALFGVAGDALAQSALPAITVGNVNGQPVKGN